MNRLKRIALLVSLLALPLAAQETNSFRWDEIPNGQSYAFGKAPSMCWITTTGLN
ncbi:MAG: hypothetical protein U5J83_05950 [Bryobacterales bacterium]|nr:hypothetical protein [Bryobacterales bacterium]